MKYINSDNIFVKNLDTQIFCKFFSLIGSFSMFEQFYFRQYLIQKTRHQLQLFKVVVIYTFFIVSAVLILFLIGNYKFAECGRNYLEKYIDKLVMNDGSFSQHSVVYHRLVLDTLCQIEIWRRTLNLNPFSNNFYRLCNKLIFWLYEFTDKSTGKCPNLGGNDGAYCYQYNVDAYRDFRPTLNLASFLFRSTIIYKKAGY